MSGTNDNRPEFQRMISDSSRKQFQFILVYKLDRFARNRYDSAIYKTRLKKNGVRVISATEQLGDGDESIITEAILEAMAETYSRQLSQNVKRGMKESALKGNSTGGNIPLGYKIEDKKLVINEETAPAVKIAFEEYAKGTPKQAVANILNAKGYRTVKGNAFNANTLTGILKNRVYIGDYTYKGEIERSCPALIGERTFVKVQEMTQKNKALYGRAPKSVETFELTGKLFCGLCGKPMCGDSGKSRSGEYHYYYTCTQRKNYRRTGAKKCGKKSERKGFLEWYIAEQTVEYVLTPARIKIIAEKVVGEYNKDFNDVAVKKLEGQIKRLNREIDKCVDNLMNTSVQVMIDKINQKATQLELQMNDTKEELAKLKIANRVKLTEDEVVKFLKGFCKGDLMDSNFRRKIFDAFVNSVYLFDDKVVIYYNVKGSKQVSYIEMLKHMDELDESVRADGSMGSHLVYTK